MSTARERARALMLEGLPSGLTEEDRPRKAKRGIFVTRKIEVFIQKTHRFRSRLPSSFLVRGYGP